MMIDDEVYREEPFRKEDMRRLVENGLAKWRTVKRKRPRIDNMPVLKLHFPHHEMKHYLIAEADPIDPERLLCLHWTQESEPVIRTFSLSYLEAICYSEHPEFALQRDTGFVAEKTLKEYYEELRKEWLTNAGK